MYDDYPEEAPEATGQELMEIDGMLLVTFAVQAELTVRLDEGPLECCCAA